MQKLFGSVLLAVAAFMVVGFVQVGAWSFAGLFALLIGAGLPGATGLYLLLGGRARRTAAKAELRARTIDSELLRLAAEREGKLTVVEVVTTMALSSEEAGRRLDELARKGMAELHVSDSGQIVYDFPQVRMLEDKDSARGILDD